jgi:hypothetical protein
MIMSGKHEEVKDDSRRLVVMSGRILEIEFFDDFPLHSLLSNHRNSENCVIVERRYSMLMT